MTEQAGSTQVTTQMRWVAEESCPCGSTMEVVHFSLDGRNQACSDLISLFREQHSDHTE